MNRKVVAIAAAVVVLVVGVVLAAGAYFGIFFTRPTSAPVSRWTSRRPR